MLTVEPAAAGATLRVEGRDVLPHVVARLVGSGADVYAAIPRPPTLEDVYFEIEARRAASAGLPPAADHVEVTA